MAIAVTRVNQLEWFDQATGALIRKARLNVTGLTPAAANSIPHGLTAANPTGNPATQAAIAPQRVTVLPWNATAPAAQAPPTLDGTNGGSVSGGGANGFDSTNIYVFVAAGVSTAAFEVEY